MPKFIAVCLRPKSSRQGHCGGLRQIVTGIQETSPDTVQNNLLLLPPWHCCCYQHHRPLLPQPSPPPHNCPCAVMIKGKDGKGASGRKLVVTSLPLLRTLCHLRGITSSPQMANLALQLGETSGYIYMCFPP